MKHNKAISQVVGMILVALITIALAGLAFVWAAGYFHQTTETAEGSTTMIQSWNMVPRIVNLAKANDTSIYFYVKNIGSQTIPEDSLIVFVNYKLIENVTHEPVIPRGSPVLVNVGYECPENSTLTINIAAGSNSDMAQLAC